MPKSGLFVIALLALFPTLAFSETLQKTESRSGPTGQMKSDGTSKAEDLGNHPSVAVDTGPSSGDLSAHHEHENLESIYPDIPRLNLRGFLDLSFGVSDEANQKTDSFSIGQLDLLITSRISDRVSFLAETYFSNPETGASTFILTRAAIQYSISNPFNLRFGAVHANLGYWNHVYHHGSFFQTTVSRPEIYRYDRAYLPIHSFGAEIFGVIELPFVDIEHDIGVFNGRGRTPGAAPRVKDLNDQKAVGVLVSAKPHAVDGLKLGASVYLDKIPPDPGILNRAESILERILGAYSVYRANQLEVLGEVFRVYHDDETTAKAYKTLGLYVQGAYAIGSVTPYYRFDLINFGNDDPLYFSYFSPRISDLTQHTLGMRWDFMPWNAFKIEYVYSDNKGMDNDQSLTANLSFTF